MEQKNLNFPTISTTRIEEFKKRDSYLVNIQLGPQQIMMCVNSLHIVSTLIEDNPRAIITITNVSTYE